MNLMQYIEMHYVEQLEADKHGLHWDNEKCFADKLANGLVRANLVLVWTVAAMVRAPMAPLMAPLTAGCTNGWPQSSMLDHALHALADFLLRLA